MPMQFTSAFWRYPTIGADEILYRVQLRLCADDLDLWEPAFDCLAHLRAQHPVGCVALSPHPCKRPMPAFELLKPRKRKAMQS